MARVLKRFTLVCIGSSLTTGRLAGPDVSWVALLAYQLPAEAEALGPIDVYNMGKGSQNSAWGVTQIDAVAAYKPTHILMEGFAINDCVDFGAGPAISRAAHIANMTAMVTAWKAQIPGVDITIQTMNPVSVAGAGIRPQLPAYYADEVATAAMLGVRILDNYTASAKPLDPTKSNGAVPFVLPVTAGFDGQPSGAAWNPADVSNLTLSADLLSATSAAANGMVRGNMPLTGKVHMEFLISGPIVGWSGNTYGWPSFGVATAASSLAGGPMGRAVGAAGLLAGPGGNVSVDGVFTGGAGFSTAQGDVVGIEVDVPNSLIYFLKSATRSAGISIASLTGSAIYPAMSLQATNASWHFTEYGDGLHPLFTGWLDTYLYPNVMAWARARMGEYWALPVNTGVPAISGPAYEGAHLTGDPGAWTGAPSFAYQWLRGFTPIAGAVFLNRDPSHADVGSQLRLRVAATNDVGTVFATSAPTAVITAAPAGGQLDFSDPNNSGLIAAL